MTGKQRAALRKMANQLDTIIYIGKEGVTDSVIKETYDALEARELIKGCVQQGAPLDAKTARWRSGSAEGRRRLPSWKQAAR